MTRRVALVGANGQLGCDLQRAWAERCPSDTLVTLGHTAIEVGDGASVCAALQGARPDLVINTSAFHKVDVVEDDVPRAFEVNAIGARNLALVCRDLEAVLVHLSTDYVFSGDRARPYREDDGVDPVNTYGVSKAAGEMLIRYLWPRHFIVRSSGLYGVAGSSGKGGNFVELMLKLGSEGRPIRVVNDQVLTPTATRALARQVAALCGTTSFGTYHATCQGQCSWYEFAVEIFRQTKMSVSLSPQTTMESGAKARRPSFSVLDNARLREIGLDIMPPWQDALAGYLRERRE